MPVPPTATAVERADTPQSCALIDTDDDIPSGSPTAGALYVENAALGRRLLTADVVAVARGFLAGGVPCVHVLDSHDGAIDPAPLEAIGVRLITPSNATWTWPFFGPMVESYAMAALVGFHAPAGSDGMRPHTINDSVRALRINGKAVGEVSHIVLGLGGFGIPVVLVSGDAHATREGEGAVPGVATVTVRWREPNGEIGFLSQEAAGQELYEAARAKALAPPPPPTPAGPVRAELRGYSLDLMRALLPKLPPRFLASVESRRVALDGDARAVRLDPHVFDGSRVTADGRWAWTAPDVLTAFVSIAAAASQLRGPNNWDEVTRGYKAFRAGEYDTAIEAYDRALSINPYDTPTHCRLAAALHAAGDPDRAHHGFLRGYQRMHEVGNDSMKAWCSLGLAEVALQRGDLSTAREAALQLFALRAELPRLARAHHLLDEVTTKQRPPRRHALEGFSPIEAVTDAFTRIHRLPSKADTVVGSLRRAGQVIVPRGTRQSTEAEIAATYRTLCTLPHRRQFNAHQCNALDERRCEGQSCKYDDYAVCSGVFVDRGLFVTTAHCLGDELHAGDSGPDLTATRHGWRDRRWHSIAYGVSRAKRLVPPGPTVDPLGVVVLWVDDDEQTPGPLLAAAAPGRGQSLYTLGFPRSDRQGPAGARKPGHATHLSEPAVSFGHVVRSQPRRTTFVSNAHTAPGHEGSPVFDRHGRWLGISLAGRGADPGGDDQATHTVHLRSQAIVEALEQARDEWATSAPSDGYRCAGQQPAHAPRRPRPRPRGSGH